MTIEIPKIPNHPGDQFAYSPEDYERHVARGAVWLDKNFPGWERKVDLELLEISDPETCICGQVVPAEMVKAAQVSFGYWAVFKEDSSTPYAHGFSGNEHGDYWVALIKDRFDRGELSDSAFEGASVGSGSNE